jgi:hypothetical protein
MQTLGLCLKNKSQIRNNRQIQIQCDLLHLHIQKVDKHNLCPNKTP